MWLFKIAAEAKAARDQVVPSAFINTCSWGPIKIEPELCDIREESDEEGGVTTASVLEASLKKVGCQNGSKLG